MYEGKYLTSLTRFGLARHSPVRRAKMIKSVKIQLAWTIIGVARIIHETNKNALKSSNIDKAFQGGKSRSHLVVCSRPHQKPENLLRIPLRAMLSAMIKNRVKVICL